MKITHEVQISASKDAFTNSREALARLLMDFGHQIHNLKEDLELENYQNIKKFPEYLTSLTHTKGAGAAVLAKKDDYLSLGIDIEWGDRVLKEGTQKFFRNAKDSLYENDLELWTMKEAAFKALSPLGLFPGVLVLSKIIIQNGEFWTNESKDLRGKVSTIKRSYDNRELMIAIAKIEIN